jgi:hypothetical protein
MAFKKITGVKGKLFIPEEQPSSKKKHACKDCFSCGWCDDDRCSLCLKKKKKCCQNDENI